MGKEGKAEVREKARRERRIPQGEADGRVKRPDRNRVV